MFYLLEKEYIIENLDDLLCQYSEENDFLLFDKSFEPESFTAQEKREGKKTLFFNEMSYEEWIGNMLEEQFESSGINHELIGSAVQCGIKNFNMLMDVCGKEHKMYNQEVVDILRRISVFTVTGKLGDNFNTAEIFNEFAHKIMPIVVKKIEAMDFSSKEILKLSIISGMSGLDLKGATAAASQHANDGIPMKDLINLNIENAAKIYLKRLLDEYEKRNYPIFDYDELINSIESKPHFNLIWMTDDIIESYFDLIIIERLLAEYDLTIKLIPKNGRFGNDASFDDICSMMSPKLVEFKENGKFTLSDKGPKMAAANLKKLSKEHAMSIVNSDVLLLKGCRISEMFNGGINADTYIAYSIVRKLSENLTGFASESNSTVLVHLNPGEYAFWGVKGCDEIFSMGRTYSTMKEHFSREYDVESIIKRFNSIKDLTKIYENDLRPLYQELDLLTDRIVNLNTSNYNKVASTYSSLERRNIENFEENKWAMLINEIKKTYGSVEGIKVLDVGMGDGKSMDYAQRMGFDIWGCDICDEFIKITQDLMPPEYSKQIKKCDMRSLVFGDESFDVVRHNATLVHMPLIGPGYGSDKAIGEASRVLKSGGFIYISVKMGNSQGICSINTNEDLGDRIYQLYSANDIKNLLSDNGFDLVGSDIINEKRNPSHEITWYNVIAKKR